MAPLIFKFYIISFFWIRRITITIFQGRFLLINEHSKIMMIMATKNIKFIIFNVVYLVLIDLIIASIKV